MVCVYVHVRVWGAYLCICGVFACVHECIWVCIPVHLWRQEKLSGVLVLCSALVLWNKVSSWAQLGWWSQGHGPPSFIPHSSGTAGECEAMSGIFYEYRDQKHRPAQEALLPTESLQYCPCFNKASREELFLRKTVRCKLHLHSLLFLWMACTMAVMGKVHITLGSFRTWSALYLQEGNRRFSLRTVC